MDDYVTLRSLIVGLRSASSFEEASDMCLRVMLDVTRRGLELTAPQARVLRATVHLRSHEGYRRVHTLEEDVRPRQTHDDPSSLQSANAWRWIVRHARPVTIDVVLGMVHPTSRHEEDAGPSTPGFGNAETRQRLLGRNVTHVHVVPLHGVGGGIEGMISVEAHCPPLGAGVVPRPSLELLEALAAAAAPSLISLPAQRIDPPARDPLLPVVGGAMSGTVDLVRLFARQEETLLLVGPTGTGKSRLARWAHAQSKRREHTFETVDLLSVPEDVQSAELFGWKRGAFTGAVQDTPGHVARADQGTLFLDEVDKLSLQTQAALLRLLEERVYRPVGEARGERPADVRFIIGTNADLKAAVQDGRFREDLYDRLNVLPVKIPPLDERADEIADWADFMLDRHHRETAANGRARLAEGAGETLRARRWPGNLRQLDNVVRRAYALASGDRAGRETPETPRDVEIATRHIERALAGESANRIDLLEEWRRAARAFVLEVERRRSGSGQHLPMDMLDAFRGLVLEEAQQGRPPTEALKLLGLDRDVESRNHHRTIRWGRDKVEALKRALSNTPPPSPDDPQGAREARK